MNNPPQVSPNDCFALSPNDRNVNDSECFVICTVLQFLGNQTVRNMFLSTVIFRICRPLPLWRSLLSYFRTCISEILFYLYLFLFSFCFLEFAFVHCWVAWNRSRRKYERNFFFFVRIGEMTKSMKFMRRAIWLKIIFFS